ncbi:MAG: hypothetical protein KDC43_29840 [Saprospiraceae bacterium]|nr:hypothetical protein [Saprospiraceae bacterium]
MKAISQPMTAYIKIFKDESGIIKAVTRLLTALIRIFKHDDAKMGDKWEITLHANYYDEGRVVYLSGLKEGITPAGKSALVRLLKDEGVHYMRWSHTNNKGHEVHVCGDVRNGGKLKLE